MPRLQRVSGALLFTVVVLLVARAAPAAGEPAAATEYQIKAAFLYNFALFVEWPPDAAPPGTPFLIGIFGEDPFGADVGEAMKDETVNGRPIVIKHFSRVEDLEFSHILFIRAAERARLRSILDAVHRWSALTVGETERFTEQGGMVNFTLKGNRVRFEINREATARAGLKISSKLLNLAEEIRDSGRGREQ
jgi:hypothetical protein